MAQAKQLVLLSETELDSRAPRGFPVGCPTLDVASTWDSTSRSLLVYRPPGQVITKMHQLSVHGEAAPEAVAVSWSPDGQFLAVGWSDGVVRLMRLENNKVAHRIPVCQGTEAQITYIGWTGSHLPKQTSNSTASLLSNGTLASDAALEGADELPVNLPQALTFLEIDSALPKLSPLPSGSAGSDEDANVFTLRAGVDLLFQPPKQEDHDTVNVLVVGTSDGSVQLSIHDSFVVGTFQRPVMGTSSASQLIHHASHPDVSTHALVLADNVLEPCEIQLLPMDLPFISSSPINLSLLASKLTTLQKLLRYLKQAQLHMQVEWRNARELPARFLRAIQGDLEEMQRGPRGIVPALYHVVVTGHAHEPVREWLADTLAERGHKRWEKAVVSGLENLRSIVHENFLPALERCALIFSRLRGLAQFHDDRDDIGFSVSQIKRVLDIIGCLHLVGHKVLSHVMDELEHFAVFSTWLRFQIEQGLAADSGQELTEKEATMDTSKVLTYIEKYLTQSPLDIFFDDISSQDCTADWHHCEDGPSLLQMLDTQLKKREDGQPGMRALPQVHFLVNYMTTWCGRIFQSVAESMKRSVRFGKPITLSVGAPITRMDVRVSEGGKGGLIYTALACKDRQNKVYILRVEMDIVNGISRNLPPTGCCVDLVNCQLIDAKFLNDETLVVLCKEQQDLPSVIMLIPVQSNKLPYAPWDEKRLKHVGVVPTEGFVKHVIPGQQQQQQQSTRFVRMELHDRSEAKGEIPERICFLSSNQTTWRTFSMGAAS